MVDYTQVIINFGQSLDEISRLTQGLSYTLGLICVFLSLRQFYTVSGAGRQGGGNVNAFVALCYLVGGTFLLYLPSYSSVATNTLFGSGNNAIAYDENWAQAASYGTVTYYIEQFIRVGGLIFFVRGTVLLMQASLPGAQHGLKGLAFLFGGVMMMNYLKTQSLLASLLDTFIAWRTNGL